MLLAVDRVESSYDATQVLFGVSIGVAAGDFVTLLGRNGMGRSTLINTIMGFIKPRAGTILFDGKPIQARPCHEVARYGIGLVPEGRRVFPTLTVYENLIAFQRGERNRAAAWTVDRVYKLFPRLKERKGQLAATLSGGEQQMLAIARALVTNPRLLILDEATEGLAPLVSEEIWSSLRELRREGLSIIVTDKNLKPLLDLASRHYVLSKGRVVWEGTSEEFNGRQDELKAYLGV
ncbi:ABC transporter ATP-binding protein [Pseudolabrys taiwanensis]|uniref:ABC transporter ATP-binding protein n=1 Tax=Pseudolabrys taiwanensis TaxID=331696 RepID=A0A346A148_9HYPH|nr:ABC transporter ATP-binding protein [Pseudolabrys taiwanensis]